MLANNCLHCLSCHETILGLIVYLPEMKKIARTSLLSLSSSLLLPTYVEHKKNRPTGRSVEVLNFALESSFQS